jgi:hypothetical protein
LPVMPPITISSLVGSGCTCGLQCACPGCIQHRGREHASKDRRDCADGCGSCINHAGGIELPSLSSGTNPPSILDQFFARAAALPRPPTSRKIGAGIHIDPMNVMVYPTTALETEEHGIAFGLVSLPKLECCGGVCGCPEGRCGCGKACDGSCAHHNAVERVGASSSGGKGHSSSSALPSEFLISPSPAPVRACCAE